MKVMISKSRVTVCIDLMVVPVYLLCLIIICLIVTIRSLIFYPVLDLFNLKS
ncbi:MAG: hypothetical protein RLZZ435_1478 [Cyanobacteriota bacterium]